MSKRVLFICLGNACRSQIAEAFAKYYCRGGLEVYSGGIKPAGFIHQRAVAVMKEIGISLNGQQSKPVDWTNISKMDWVITLTEEAKVAIPPLPNHVRTLHWPIEDPIAVFGNDDRVLQAFRITRDEIEEKVMEFIESLKQP